MEDNEKLLEKLAEALGNKWKFFVHPAILAGWGIKFVTVRHTIFKKSRTYFILFGLYLPIFRYCKSRSNVPFLSQVRFMEFSTLDFL
jgi:hypothetical protein